MEDKYSLPWTHDAIQSQTLLELLITFWEDYYTDNRQEAHRTADGEVYYQTGDPYIDKWERELAMGITPDLLEGITKKKVKTDEEKQVEEEIKAKADDLEAELDGFVEDYRSKLEKTPPNFPVLGSRGVR